ncbi:hypothetical protein MRB53_038695 [Persea americana]|nr:hypothetical protein MRB53_038695 [Persea americana]
MKKRSRALEHRYYYDALMNTLITIGHEIVRALSQTTMNRFAVRGLSASAGRYGRYPESWTALRPAHAQVPTLEQLLSSSTIKSALASLRWARFQLRPSMQTLQSLLRFFRHRAWHVIHIYHDSVRQASPLYPGKECNAPLPYSLPLPGETVLRKSTSSAFAGTKP